MYLIVKHMIGTFMAFLHVIVDDVVEVLTTGEDKTMFTEPTSLNKKECPRETIANKFSGFWN